LNLAYQVGGAWLDSGSSKKFPAIVAAANDRRDLYKNNEEAEEAEEANDLDVQCSKR